MTAAEARLRGRVGGLAVVARHGPYKVAARARQGLRAKFEAEADPLGTLSIEERQRRTDLIQRRYYAELTMQSVRARRDRPRRAARK